MKTPDSDGCHPSLTGCSEIHCEVNSAFPGEDHFMAWTLMNQENFRVATDVAANASSVRLSKGALRNTLDFELPAPLLEVQRN